MKYVNKLVGMFQRLHTEREFEETGVGLALVKRLLNRHGREVWAESQMDNGAVLYFTVSNKGATH
jgi:light-regulated signal transduction histidine kinase (bacteriophytochrome)